MIESKELVSGIEEEEVRVKLNNDNKALQLENERKEIVNKINREKIGIIAKESGINLEYKMESISNVLNNFLPKKYKNSDGILGRNILYSYLREIGFLRKVDNRPYQTMYAANLCVDLIYEKTQLYS